VSVSIYDNIGKYAVDKDNNTLPRTREWVLKYAHHTGKEVFCESPTGDSTDSVVFGHLAGDSAEAINKLFEGRMVRIHQELMYNYQSEVWYWFNTIYYA